MISFTLILWSLVVQQGLDNYNILIMTKHSITTSFKKCRSQIQKLGQCWSQKLDFLEITIRIKNKTQPEQIRFNKWSLWHCIDRLHILCTNLGHIPAQPKNMGIVWCCTELCIGNQEIYLDSLNYIGKISHKNKNFANNYKTGHRVCPGGHRECNCKQY